MTLPFTHAQFLDVFGAYNAALWPAAAMLWVATLAVLAWRVGRGAQADRAVAWLLAAHWAWSGVAYHWMFFRSINPAAAVFAGLFVFEALLFAWMALAPSGLHIEAPRGPWGALAVVLIVYALLYPLAGLGFGLAYPRMPIFAVPCPTAILTCGVLLLASPVRRLAAIVPILWSAIGGSAAFLLGITADLALVAAGTLLLFRVLSHSDAAIGRRSKNQPDDVRMSHGPR